MEFELVEALDATHGGEDGDLNVEVIEFVAGDRQETGILEGCGARHLRDDLMQRRVLTEVADATTQMALFVEGDEGTALLLEGQGDRGHDSG